MMDQFRDSRDDASAAAAAADSELLILVDEDDREVGYLNKTACHQGVGVLHRAFSVLIFNHKGELLLQQRAASKRLWPLYWSNTCCSLRAVWRLWRWRFTVACTRNWDCAARCSSYSDSSIRRNSMRPVPNRSCARST